jgi:hypothetical protein
MAQQVGQHIEDLGLHIDDLAGAAQLDTLDAELAVPESNPHVRHRAPNPQNAQIDSPQPGCGES